VLRIAIAAVAVIAVFMGAMYLRFSGEDNGNEDNGKNVSVVVAAKDIPPVPSSPRIWSRWFSCRVTNSSKAPTVTLRW
jgi:hypothetical protein